MALAAATGPHLQLRSFTISRPSKVLFLQQQPHQHLRVPALKAVNRSCRSCPHGRFYRLVIRANADTVPVQGDTAQACLSPEEEEDFACCREILRVLDMLKEKRDMPFNEVRLTIKIEDPYEEEQRKFDMENARGCSRDDMADALVDVYEGRIPTDRTVLRELYKEMMMWPNLEQEAEAPSDPSQSPYARSTDTGIDPRVVPQKKKSDFDEAAEIQPGEEAEDANVPPVVGFSVLYLVSAIPILIGIAVVAILFLNSFR